LSAIYILCAVCKQTSVSVFAIRRDLVQMKTVKCVVAGGAPYSFDLQNSLRMAPRCQNM